MAGWQATPRASQNNALPLHKQSRSATMLPDNDAPSHRSGFCTTGCAPFNDPVHEYAGSYNSRRRKKGCGEHTERVDDDSDDDEEASRKGGSSVLTVVVVFVAAVVPYFAVTELQRYQSKIKMPDLHVFKTDYPGAHSFVTPDEKSSAEEDEERRPGANISGMNNPRLDLLRAANQVLRNAKESILEADGLLSKLDSEKFKTTIGAWEFQVNQSEVEAKVREQFQTTGEGDPLPDTVIDSVVQPVKDNAIVNISKWDFHMDGSKSDGHVSFVGLRGKTDFVKGTVSVAAMVSVISFKMTVVSEYETKEVPTYESVLTKQLKRKGECHAVTEDGEACQFPFQYRSLFFNACTKFLDTGGRAWCSTVRTYNNNSEFWGWGYCAEEFKCEADRYTMANETRPAGNVTKKFPVFAQQTLPDGVTQTSIAQALHITASRKVQKLL
eukprot:gnl/TRDRNA2_/TRDRNA2_84772_c0_seq2.p1 gnl/TRDRNA2_/TRDRNA2_84772_c0~~gnl/TRDRNA2_/TRDRNA2_84772_c0_seq2.p1  ORF type:complete len:447 (+),score=51.01 gnl/TRDRNA2_/TRDRNA2_84772_c0_seq2:23-1342(+)